MATTAFAACVDRFESLSGVPTLYTLDVPINADGTPILPPYAAILDDGTTPEFDFEHIAFEQTEVTIMLYADTLAEVDAYAERVKYNGGTTAGALGMDFGALPTLTIPYTNLIVQRVSERHFLATATGNAAQRIFGMELKYRISLYRS